MPRVVGVAFRQGGKTCLYDPDDLKLAPGDEIVVPAARGFEYGRVVSPVREVGDDDLDEPLKKVLRRATEGDRRRQRENEARRKEAYHTCRRMIRKHGLQMKLVDVDQVFDGSSLVFYFTAEARVDFRELVKELASTLQARIELRQVGVRDEAKMVGGLGQCGRDLCCSLFLSDFNPVSIKMAKEQDLPLNPSKISGICGRLMCCLKYEVEAYEEFNRNAPSLGSSLETSEGAGRVVGYRVPCGMVMVELESGRRIGVKLDDYGHRRSQRAKKGRRRRRPEGRGGGSPGGAPPADTRGS